MKRMAASNVLIVGVRGLGIEIGWRFLSICTFTQPLIFYEAKNIVLAGVRSVTIFDPEPVQIQDLGTQVRYCRLSTMCHAYLSPASSSFDLKMLEKAAQKLLSHVWLNSTPMSQYEISVANLASLSLSI